MAKEVSNIESIHDSEIQKLIKTLKKYKPERIYFIEGEASVSEKKDNYSYTFYFIVEEKAYSINVFEHTVNHRWGKAYLSASEPSLIRMDEYLSKIKKAQKVFPLQGD